MMILKFALFLSVGVFVLKIVFNNGIPYALVWRHIKKDKSDTSSISLMPIEILLYGIAIALASFISEIGWFYSAKNLAVWGLIVIFSTYVHMTLMTFILWKLFYKSSDEEGGL